MESPSFQSVGKVEEFPEGCRRLVQVGRQPVLVLHLSGKFLAFDDYCPHRAGPLSEGTITDTTVTCPWHHAHFDLATGAALSGPTQRGLKLRKVRIQNGLVEVLN